MSERLTGWKSYPSVGVCVCVQDINIYKKKSEYAEATITVFIAAAPVAVAVLLLAVSGGDIVLSQKLDFVCRLLLLLLLIPFF